MTSPAESSAAIVRAAVAPLHAEPKVSSPQVSQRLAGHPLSLLESRDDWWRARGDDGYEGWVHRGYLSPLNGAAPRDRLRTSLGCAIRDETGERRRLPLGALLEESDTLEEGEALSPAICRRVFPRDPSVVAETALERFAGAPYQWGGVTPWGADCSGFVQTVFALHAVQLPRDAWQQAETGEPVEGDFWALRPADLLFFSDREDRRITHVGLALGPMRMVHLALGRGGYAVEQLDDEDDPYVKALRERFLFARRVIGAHEHSGKPNLVVVRP